VIRAPYADQLLAAHRRRKKSTSKAKSPLSKPRASSPSLTSTNNSNLKHVHSQSIPRWPTFVPIRRLPDRPAHQPSIPDQGRTGRCPPELAAGTRRAVPGSQPNGRAPSPTTARSPANRPTPPGEPDQDVERPPIDPRYNHSHQHRPTAGPATRSSPPSHPQPAARPPVQPGKGRSPGQAATQTATRPLTTPPSRTHPATRNTRRPVSAPEHPQPAPRPRNSAGQCPHGQ
jgi:hypothetical protein